MTLVFGRSRIKNAQCQQIDQLTRLDTIDMFDMWEGKAKSKVQRTQILRRLGKLWEAHPEFSLAQILEACFHQDTPMDHCFWETSDVELLAAIEAHFDSEKVVN